MIFRDYERATNDSTRKVRKPITAKTAISLFLLLLMIRERRSLLEVSCLRSRVNVFKNSSSSAIKSCNLIKPVKETPQGGGAVDVTSIRLPRKSRT